jgi:uncharacterized protein YozE (UPF0346 family)
MKVSMAEAAKRASRKIDSTNSTANSTVKNTTWIKTRIDHDEISNNVQTEKDFSIGKIN